MKRETKIILALFFIAFVIRVIFAFHNPLLIWDETVYANLGYDLSKNPLHYSLEGAGWSDFIPSKGEIYAWPNIGFRAPLLPYTLAIFYSLNLEFLIRFFMPLIGALSVVLIYFLGRKLFNKEVALYSSIFLMLLPLHTLQSGMVLTDVYTTFFLLLTFICFWKGFEEKNNKFKVLFGVFFALSLLSRYTALWFIPVFFLYFLIRDKSIKFLKDKYLWYSILVFFIILIPLFIYSQITYGNVLGAFIHGGIASFYWGGSQKLLFFFEYHWKMFSILGIGFLLSLFIIFKKKAFARKEVYLLLLWGIVFLIFASIMPHKEERFILPFVPAMCLLCGFALSLLKRYKKQILVVLILILIIANGIQFYDYAHKFYNGTTKCFGEANNYINSLSGDFLIIADESSINYYYTHQSARFYPNPWSMDALTRSVESTNNQNNTYIFFTDYDMPLYDEEHIQIRNDLENNFEKVFECDKDWGLSSIYVYS